MGGSQVDLRKARPHRLAVGVRIMCGIAGVVGATWANREVVEKMVAALHHRGPDDRGVMFRNGVGLGMARLAILDLTAAGHQPMTNADGSIVIVYNGETYNFQEQRQLLEGRGYSFSSRTDTEVVLRMYEAYGDDFLKRMRGMFALAICDFRAEAPRLLLARDHLGIKPLLYSLQGQQLVFASELKALLFSGCVSPRLDPEALRLLLTFGAVVQPRTILEGVAMLPAGHRLIYQYGVARVERYWQMSLNRHPELGKMTYQDQIECVSEAVEESLRLHAISDAPLGAFLSGGVDSSLTTALLVRQGRTNLRTFSIGFEDEGRALDESGDAELTARFLGTDHERIPITGSFVRQHIQRIARALDQPTLDGLNSYLIAWASSQKVKVAVSGTGGDELFAGYPSFITMLKPECRDWRAWRSAFMRLPAFDRLALSRFGNRVEAYRGASGFLPRYARTQQVFGVQAGRYLQADLRWKVNSGREPSRDIAKQDELPGANPVERVTALCLRGYTQNMLLRDIDVATMAHSLEVRVPLLDVKLLELSLSLPARAKLGSGSGQFDENATYRASGAKKILLDIGEPLFRPGMADQPKRGFSMPQDAWLKGPLREVLLDTLSEASVRRRGLLDPVNVAAVRDHFLSGNGYWTRPWLLMMLEVWCREVLDR